MTSFIGLVIFENQCKRNNYTFFWRAFQTRRFLEMNWDQARIWKVEEEVIDFLKKPKFSLGAAGDPLRPPCPWFPPPPPQIFSGYGPDWDYIYLQVRLVQIAEIADLVSPMDTHQFFFPQRRIFVYHFGYFQFDQVAEQKPELVDYGPWIADMEIQVFFLLLHYQPIYRLINRESLEKKWNKLHELILTNHFFSFRFYSLLM